MDTPNVICNSRKPPRWWCNVCNTDLGIHAEAPEPHSLLDCVCKLTQRLEHVELTVAHIEDNYD